MADNIKNLWNTLRNSGYNPPSYDQFAKDMKDEKNLRKVYSTLKAEGYTPPAYEQFKSDMGYVQKAKAQASSAAKVPTTANTTNTGKVNASVNPSYTQPAEAESKVTQASWDLKSTMPKGKVNAPQAGVDVPLRPKSYSSTVVEPIAKQMEKKPKYEEAPIFKTEQSDTGNGINQKPMISNEPNPEVTNNYVETTPSLTTATGEVISAPDVKGMEENSYDAYKRGIDIANKDYSYEEYGSLRAKEANRKQLKDLSSDIDSQIDEATRKAEGNFDKTFDTNSLGFEITRAASMSGSNAYGGTNLGGPVLTRQGMVEMDPDVQNLKQAKRTLLEAQRTIDEADHNTKGFMERSFAAGAARGFGQKTFDASTWDMGVTDAADAAKLYDILKKADKGQKLSKSETALLDAKSVALATDAYFGSSVGYGYKAGQVTAEALPFMLEFMLNPASSIGETSQAMLTRYALKKFGKNVVKKNAGKYLTAKIATRVGGDIAGATAMTATTGSVGVIGDTYNRMSGDIQNNYDTNGEARYAGHIEGEDFGTALTKSAIGRTIENHSEMLGEYFKPILSPISKWVGGKIANGVSVVAEKMPKLKLDKVADFIENSSAHDVLNVVNQFEKKAKWAGTISEYAEEVVGNVENALLVGDNNFKITDENGDLSFHEQGSVFNAKDNLETFLGVSLMGGFFSTLKTGMYAKERYDLGKKLKSTDAQAASLFTEEGEWATIKKGLDENPTDALDELLKNPDYSADQKKVATDYVKYQQMLNGANKATLKRRTAADSDPIQTEAEMSYDNGRTLEGQDKNDAKNNLGYCETELKKVLGLSEDDELPDENDIYSYLTGSYINADGLNLSLNDEQKSKALAYLNAKATYDGMIDAAKDDIEGKVEASNNLIDRNTNKESGNIIRATLNDDRDVYIISGNVAQNDDDTINVNSSTKSLVVKDCTTGKIDMIDAANVTQLYVPVNAQQVKDENAESIRQQEAQRHADDIDGKVKGEVGETFQVPDGKGGLATVTINAINTDEAGNVVGYNTTWQYEDGSSVDYENQEMEGLQAWKDEANLQRLQQDKAQKVAEAAEVANEVVNEEEGEAAPAAEEPAPATRTYTNGDSLVLRDDDGLPTNANVISDIDADGYYEVQSDEPINGKIVNKMRAEDIDARIQQHNDEVVMPAEEETPTEQPVAEGTPATEQPAEAPEAASTETAPTEEIPAEETTEQPVEVTEQPQAETEQPAESEPAINRIPRNETWNKGEKKVTYDWENAAPEDTFDAINETFGDRAETAIANKLAKAKKAVKEAETKVAKFDKMDVDELMDNIDKEQQAKAELEAAKKTQAYWESVANVPATRATAELKAQQQADEATRTEREAETKAKREQAEKEAAERAEAERVEREKLNGVPDVVNDKPADARARGYRNVNGVSVERQQQTTGVTGRESNVKFSNKETAKGHIKVIEAEQLQPSHENGRRNPFFFIDEAQPKNRTDEASQLAASKIAENINPEEITGDGSAYQFSAPTVNTHGETIQGNNRSAALKQMWAGGNTEQQNKYKQYLLDHAEEFGLDREAVTAMQHPVMVNELDVDDNEAIRLGQFASTDNESGGVQRIDPVTTSRGLGNKVGNFASILLSSEDENASISDLLVDNGKAALQYLHRQGVINDTQFQSAFDSKGNITPEAKMDLQNILKQSLFQGGASDLPTMFNKLPAKAQKAVLSTFMRDFDCNEADKILPEIQSAIELLYEAITADESVAKASNINEARAKINNYTHQYRNVNGEMVAPVSQYSPLAIEIATRMQGLTMKGMSTTFNDYYDAVQGKGSDMFDENAGKKLTADEAKQKVFNIKPNNNGSQISNNVAGNNQESQPGRQGSSGNSTVGERNSQGEQPADNRAGSTEQPTAEVGGLTLGSKTDNEGNHFYEKNGSIDLWNIPEELFKKARRQSAPVRLTDRNIQHIIDEHKREVGDTPERVVEFLNSVFNNATILRKANGGAMFLVVNNEKTDKAAVIKLYPSQYGDYYNVDTAGFYRKDKWKDNEEVIAELSEPTQSDVASDVSKPHTPKNNDKEQFNAETATSSASKESNSSANNQTNAEENAANAEKVDAASTEQPATLTGAASNNNARHSLSEENGVQSNGFENNYGKELLELCDKIGKQLGIKITFLDTAGMLAAVNQDANGASDTNGNIFINVDRVKKSRVLSTIFGHELTHTIKRYNNAKTWDAFLKAVKEQMGAQFDAEFARKRKLYDDAYDARGWDRLSEADIAEEVCCDWAGMYAVSNPDFARQIVENAKNAGVKQSSIERLINKIIELFDSALKVITTPEEVRKLENARNLWQQLYNEATQNSEINSNEGTKHSLSEEAAKELNAIKESAIADGTFMKAPNGKATNLTEKQWLQTRTKAFKDWFGDWENNPAEASKVVDENGEPMVVHHGSRSNSPIKIFKEYYEKGTFFTTSRNIGNTYATNLENLYSAYINSKNPLIIDNEGKDWNKIEPSKLVDAAQKLFGVSKEEFLNSVANENLTTDGIVGAIARLSNENNSPYDSFILKNVVETEDNEVATDVVTFKSNQVKSATDNSGDFSKENNDIRFSLDNASEEEKEEAGVKYSLVEDPFKIAELESGKKVKVYRAMQQIDGKLYPPMAAKQARKLVNPIEIGKWEQADEHPELIDKDGKFRLNKGNGSSIEAAYNPYIHTSMSPLNDQFSSAWNRPNLVTVEVEVPESELTSGYKAEHAKDAVGLTEWKSGGVSNQLKELGKPRQVILSRYDKPVRIVPIEEVAGKISDLLEGTDIAIPFNAVTPELRDALAERGVKIDAPEKGSAGKAAVPAYDEWKNGKGRFSLGDKKETTVNERPNRSLDKSFSGSVPLSTDRDSSSNAIHPIKSSINDAAKIAKSTKSAKNKIKKYLNNDFKLHYDDIDSLLRDLATLGALRYEGGSRYAVYNADNGLKVAFRIANHIAFGDNFVQDEADKNISVIIEQIKLERRPSTVVYKEYIYSYEDYLKNKEKVADAIAFGMNNVLKYGTFIDKSGLAKEYPSQSLNLDKNQPKYSLSDDKSLVGVHNISADKLKKAIKMGGLANPSAAVFDINTHNHEGYGEISLIMPSSLVDSKTGKNAGTFDRDIWSPIYPTVQYFATNESDKKVKEFVSNIEDADVRDWVEKDILNTMQGNANGDGFKYLFLKSKGIDVDVPTKKREHNMTAQEYLDILGIDELTSAKYNNVPSENKLRAYAMYLTDGNTEKVNSILEDEKRRDLYLNSTGFGSADRAVLTLKDDEQNAGKKDMYKFRNSINKALGNNLVDEYNAWLEDTESNLGYDAKIQTGFKADGTRIYKDATLENVSKYMKKQGLVASEDHVNNSVNKILAKAAHKYRTLAQIRKNKDRLLPDNENKSHNMSEKSELLQELRDALSYFLPNKEFSLDFSAEQDATGYLEDYLINDWSFERLEEDYRKYHSAGKDFTLNEDERKHLKDLKEKIQNPTVPIFETKFERPVQLSEFASAVVPKGTDATITDALKNAGLSIFEYDPKKEGSRAKAVNKATEQDGIRFSLSENDSELHDAAKENGTEAIVGKDAFDNFLIKAYADADKETRTKITGIARNNGWNFNDATEQYLASLADKGNKESLDKVKQQYLNMLNTAGLSLDGISDNELRYQLWHNYNLKNGVKGALGVAEDVVKQMELGVGDYAKTPDVRYSLAYHGSASDFDNFDSSHFLSGEGSMVYGAGHYVTDVEGTGKMYADIAVHNRQKSQNPIVNWHGQKIDFSSVNPLRMAYDVMSGCRTIKEAVNNAERYASMAEDKEMQDKWNAAADILKQSKKSDFELKIQGNRILYTVDIPDDNGKNYIDWNAEPTNDFKAQIEKYVADKVSDAYKSKVSEDVQDKETNGDLIRFARGTEELSDYLSSLGYTGIKVPTGNNKGGDGRGVNYVIFKDSDLKIKDKTRYSLSADDVTEPDDTSHGLREDYDKKIGSSAFQAQEAFQDSMLGLKELMDILQKNSRQDKIEDWENAYMAENAMSSRNEAEYKEWERKFFAPLEEAGKAFKKAMNVDDENLTKYLMAKHGIERNREMAVRAAMVDDDGKTDKDAMNRWNQRKEDVYNDDTFPTWKDKQQELDRIASIEFGIDLNDRDYSGLTSLFGTDEDVAAAVNEAYDFVNSAMTTNEEACNALDDAVRDATKATLQKSLSSGMISKDVFDGINNMYDYYIPLRGFSEETAEDMYAYLNNEGTSGFTNVMKKAKGRSSVADSPLAYIKSMAASAILQGNRNLMKQKFLNFVLNRPSDLVSVNDLWIVKDTSSDEWVTAIPQIPEDATPEEIDDIMKKFEEDMKAKEERGEAKKLKGKPDVPYKTLYDQLGEHQILVKRAGKDILITINGNPRAAQAINGKTNPHANYSGAGKPMQLFDWINRNLSAFYTTRNPDFVVSNFIRDAIYSNSMVWVKESSAYAASFHKHFAMNLGRMWGLFRKLEKGTLDMNDDTEKRFYEFIMNGGETGYSNIKDIDELKKEVEKGLGKENMAKAVWQAFTNKMDYVNRNIENCARFAAYMASRDAGRTVERSVYDAKEISVNFNKKGAGGTFVGKNGQTWAGNAAGTSSGLFRALYIFFNAGLQGLANIGKTAKHHPGKFSAMAATYFMLGFAVPYIFSAAGGGDGDDDDDDNSSYDDLPEFVRRSNFIFRIPGMKTFFSAPLPIEFRSIYGMGELAYNLLTGKEKYSNKELAQKMTEQMTQVLPLNFMEGFGEGKHPLDPYIPSSVAPLWQVHNNTNWMGQPIYYENDNNETMPEYTKAPKNTNKILLTSAEWLNEVSGGDKYTRGDINLNPAAAEYILQGYFGGATALVNKMITTGGMVQDKVEGKEDAEWDWRKVPIANRILKSGSETTKNMAINREYQKNVEALEDYNQRLRGYLKEVKYPVTTEEDRKKFLKKFEQMVGDTAEFKKYKEFEAYTKAVNRFKDVQKKIGEDEALKDSIWKYKIKANSILKPEEDNEGK